MRREIARAHCALRAALCMLRLSVRRDGHGMDGLDGIDVRFFSHRWTDGGWPGLHHYWPATCLLSRPHRDARRHTARYHAPPLPNTTCCACSRCISRITLPHHPSCLPLTRLGWIWWARSHIRSDEPGMRHAALACCPLVLAAGFGGSSQTSNGRPWLLFGRADGRFRRTGHGPGRIHCSCAVC